MSERLNEEAVERLEILAARFYPGMYVAIDEAVDDLLGKPALWASLVVGTSPGLRPGSVTAIALVSFRPLGVRPIPATWREILTGSKGRPWKVHLFVQQPDIPKVRSAVREYGPQVEVICLPQDARRQSPVRSVNISMPV